MTSSVTSLALVVLMWLGLTLACCARSEPKQISLNNEHREAISAELNKRNLPEPTELEIRESGWLVATYEIDNGPAARSTGEDCVVAIREAMRRFNLVQSYRVTVNGPSPGTGLIRRYGSARFIEGGSVEWETAR